MALFVRKMGIGPHSFKAGGKKVRVLGGQLVECTEEDLGKYLSDYVEIVRDDQVKQKRQASPLKLETDRCYEQRRLNSWILNPDWKAVGHGQIFYTPKDVVGLREVLSGLQMEEIHAKMELQEAWLPWKLQVKNDPMGEKVLLKPEGIYVEAIAKAMARHLIAKAEIKEITSRIEALGEKIESDLEQTRKRLFMKGFLRSRSDGKYHSVDGYKVEYRDKTPWIPEKGITLREYIDSVKEYKATAVKKRARRKDPIVTA